MLGCRNGAARVADVFVTYVDLASCLLVSLLLPALTVQLLQQKVRVGLLVHAEETRKWHGAVHALC